MYNFNVKVDSALTYAVGARCGGPEKEYIRKGRRSEECARL